MKPHAMLHKAHDDGPTLTRYELARRLMTNLPVACLSVEEATAVAAFFPGHQADAVVDAFERAVRTLAPVGVSGASSVRSSWAAPSPLHSNATMMMHTSFASITSDASGSSAGFSASLQLGLLQAAAPLPDVSISAFLSWLRTLAATGACFESTASLQADSVNSPCGWSTLEFARGCQPWLLTVLPQPVRSAVRKLCCPVLGVPLPLAAFTLRADGAGIACCSSVLLSHMAQLPMSFHPSMLAPLAYTHPDTSLAAMLLDGGERRV
ncbi:MAG: hypothetical protein EOO41_02895, partial [Methanobacteriota archaeon]